MKPRQTIKLTRDRLCELYVYDQYQGTFTKRATGEINKGAKDTCGYLHMTIDGSTYSLHRLAWLYMTGEWPQHLIDHIDRNKGNNKWGNLRAASASENRINADPYKSNRSGQRGVHFYKPNSMWCARLGVRGKRLHLGYFSDFDEACAVYREAADKHYGQFARPV